MLNIRRGNMYSTVSHTWNAVSGKCMHNCVYCYVKKFVEHQRSIHLVQEEFKTDLGNNNTIFVGSGADMFADNVSPHWIVRILDYCDKFDNHYLFQSKNPANMLKYIDHPVFRKSEVGTTIETNRHYPTAMQKAPMIMERVAAMEKISEKGVDTYVTCEPIMDFDLDEMVVLIRRCHPKIVYVGRNSWSSISLPEPSNEQVESLIVSLRAFTNVELKDNVWEYHEFNPTLYVDISKDVRVLSTTGNTLF